MDQAVPTRMGSSLPAAPYFGPGDCIGDQLRVIGPVAEGHRTIVYAVRNDSEWAAMACKLLRAPWDQDRRAVERLVQEGELLASMAHPGIVRVFDINYAADPAYFLMELLEGPDLRTLLSQRQRLSVRQACQIAADTAGALAHLHRQGYLHLDIKPRNILLHRGSTRLVDLGIARVAGRRPVAGPMSGTTPYMAPEQATGGEPLTPATDVFALGVVLFELLTGERPFPRPLAPRASAAALALRFPQLAHRPLRLRDLRPGAPVGLDMLVADCLERDPRDRPSSMGAVLDALRPFVVPAAAPRPRGILAHRDAGLSATVQSA